MDYNDAFEIVKYSLGFPSVNLEIDDDVIHSFFHLALIKAMDYSNLTKMIATQAQDVILLDDAQYVIRVYSSDSTSTEIDDTALFNNYYNFQLNSKLYDKSIKSYSIIQAQSSLATSTVNRSFKFFSNKLYLYNYTGRVTIEYIPKHIEFHELESNLQSWIIKYVKCLCKEALGRIRSKYKSNSGPFEMDGDALLSEFSEERTQLEDELTTSQIGFFYVDTDNN